MSMGGIGIQKLSGATSSPAVKRRPTISTMGGANMQKLSGNGAAVAPEEDSADLNKPAVQNMGGKAIAQLGKLAQGIGAESNTGTTKRRAKIGASALYNTEGGAFGEEVNSVNKRKSIFGV